MAGMYQLTSWHMDYRRNGDMEWRNSVLWQGQLQPVSIYQLLIIPSLPSWGEATSWVGLGFTLRMEPKQNKRSVFPVLMFLRIYIVVKLFLKDCHIQLELHCKSLKSLPWLHGESYTRFHIQWGDTCSNALPLSYIGCNLGSSKKEKTFPR